jgi:hypothetical protein
MVPNRGQNEHMQYFKRTANGRLCTRSLEGETAYNQVVFLEQTY